MVLLKDYSYTDWVDQLNSLRKFEYFHSIIMKSTKIIENF